MKVGVEKVDPKTVTLDVTVDEHQVGRAWARAVREIGQRVTVPGFRRGRAPRALLERHVGSEALRQEALEVLLPEVYQEAVRKTAVEPVDRPRITLEEFAEGQAMRFKATVEVWPEVKLGDYKGLEAKLEPVSVSDEEVDRELRGLQETLATLEPLPDDALAEAGCVVKVDGRAGTSNEPPDPKRAFQDGYLELTEERLQTPAGRALVGARVGDIREVPVSPSGDEQPEEAGGDQAAISCTVTGLYRKKVPPLDDDLARAIGSFGSLQELRESVRQALHRRKTSEARAALEKRVVDEVVDRSEVELPAAMVKRRTAWLVERLVRRLADEGDPEEFLRRMSEEEKRELTEATLDTAIRITREALVLHAIARQETLEANDDEKARYLAYLGRRLGMEPHQAERLMKASLYSDKGDEVGDELTLRKVRRFLCGQPLLPELDEPGPAEAGEGSDPEPAPSGEAKA